ncbi:MAG: ATP-dependent protease subunit HslV [Candidatus Sumerlaeia bacterium]
MGSERTNAVARSLPAHALPGTGAWGGGGNMPIRSTTVVAVRRDGHIVMAGDGQVTHNNTVLKSSARKVRRIFDDKVVVGFAGATADAFTLFERFEGKLKEFNGSLHRAAVELAKDWRTDKYLRRLEAMMIAADKQSLLLLTGTGDVLAPDDDAVAIGSGGPFALAAAQALLRHTSLPARQIAEEALRIAARICIYTNEQIVVEEV